MLPPLTRLVVASESATPKLYPFDLLVETVTVSLALVTTPDPAGLSVSATVPKLLILITSLTVALIVVLAVFDAADTVIGAVATAAAATVQARTLAFCLTVLVITFDLSIFI